MRLVPALIGIRPLRRRLGRRSGQIPRKPTDAEPMVLQDTLLISTFDLVQGSSGRFQLKATLLGLAPQGYRVSAYRDFRESTGKYVSSTVARDSLCITFG